jgi:hypothetical protein
MCWVMGDGVVCCGESTLGGVMGCLLKENAAKGRGGFLTLRPGVEANLKNRT